MRILTRKRHPAKQIHSVEKIVKRALAEASAGNIRERLQSRLQDIVNDSLDTAKIKSRALRRGVANYTYKKPFISLGAAMLSGAVISFFISRYLR